MVHTGPGYWKIRNTNYNILMDGDKQRRFPVPHKPNKKPWLATWVSDNPYGAKVPMRFKRYNTALAYALLNGTPLSPEILSNLEER